MPEKHRIYTCQGSGSSDLFSISALCVANSNVPIEPNKLNIDTVIRLVVPKSRLSIFANTSTSLCTLFQIHCLRQVRMGTFNTFAEEIRRARTSWCEYPGVCCCALWENGSLSQPPTAQGLPEGPRIYPVQWLSTVRSTWMKPVMNSSCSGSANRGRLRYFCPWWLVFVPVYN
jgi:hypothetical protein